MTVEARAKLVLSKTLNNNRFIPFITGYICGSDVINLANLGVAFPENSQGP